MSDQHCEAREAVRLIVHDLCDRRGLKHEWACIDDDVLNEIRDTWATLIAHALQHKCPACPEPTFAAKHTARLARAIPARTCATCAEWDALGWTPERGMCTADVYRSESTLITPPSHSCAAWRDPVAAITEHPIMRDNREALRALRERDAR